MALRKKVSGSPPPPPRDYGLAAVRKKTHYVPPIIRFGFPPLQSEHGAVRHLGSISEVDVAQSSAYFPTTSFNMATFIRRNTVQVPPTFLFQLPS